MADSTSMFICYVLELLRWSGDAETLDLYYPVVKRAAEWQMSVSKDFGVPVKLETTYDSECVSGEGVRVWVCTYVYGYVYGLMHRHNLACRIRSRLH